MNDPSEAPALSVPADRDRLYRGRYSVTLLAIFCVLLLGSSGTFTKLSYTLIDIDPSHVPSLLLFAGCRITLTGLLVIAIYSIRKGGFVRPRGSGQWKKVVCLSLPTTVLQYGFYYFALTHASGTTAALIHGCNAFTMILMAVIVFRSERMTLRKALGCLCGVSAAFIMNFSGLKQGVHMSFAGEGCILISQIAYVYGTNLTKKYGKDTDPVLLTGWQFLIGSMILILLGAATGGHFRIATPGGMLTFLYLASLSAISYSIWGMLLKYNDVSRISVYNFIAPICGTFCAALLLGETEQAFHPGTFLALIIICIGILIVNGRFFRERAKTA